MKLRTQLLSGFLLVILFMVGLAGISYRAFISYSESSKMISHTYEVIGQAHLIEKLLSDMETGQRGFLLAGQETFLQPYTNAVNIYKSTYSGLRGLVSDNPVQIKRLEVIAELVQDWQTDAADPEISEKRKVSKGVINARKLQDILTEGLGKSILDEMRLVMDSMIERYEQDNNLFGELLTERIAKAMVDLETGQRGFLITGKDVFLEPYYFGRTQLAMHFKAIREMVGNVPNPERITGDLDELDRLSKEWLSVDGDPEIEVRRQIDAGNKSFDDLQTMLIQGKGKITLDRMREVIDRLEVAFNNSKNQKARNLVTQLAKGIVDQETGQRGFMLTGEDDFLTPFRGGQVLFQSSMDALLRLRGNVYDSKTMASDIEQLEQLSRSWDKEAAVPEIAIRRQMNLSTTSNEKIVTLIREGIGKKFMDKLRAQLKAFIEEEEGLLLEREAKAQALTKVGVSKGPLLAGTMIGIVIIGIMTMLFITHRVERLVGGEPTEIALIAERVASGDLNIEFDSEESTSGILLSVQRMVESLKINQQKAETLEWLNSGINRLDEKMRGQLNVSEMTQNVLTELATTLNAHLGTFYLVDSDARESTLTLQSSYAYTQRKNLSNRYQFGEGLVGQVALEKEPIIIRNVPADYLLVSSGLGESVPKSILVTPLVYEGEVTGVIELAWLGQTNEEQLTLMERVAPSIAINIEAAKSRESLAKAAKAI
jgi:CHASE3 domain sensor protein/putative methionine-R-sulfoxide reductase with GAF domain